MLSDESFGSSMHPYNRSALDHWNGEMIDVLGIDFASTVHSKPDEPLWQLQQGTDSEYEELVRQILRWRVRAVMALSYESSAQKFMCRLAQEKVQGMVLMHFSWFAPDWEVNNIASLPCNAEQMQAVTEFSVSVGPKMYGEDSSPLACDASGSMKVVDFKRRYAEAVSAAGETENGVGSTGADAVCMAAMLFNSLIDQGRTSQERHSMSTAVFASALSSMQRTSFQGASGLIDFTSRSEVRSGGADPVSDPLIFQKQQGAYVQLGVAQRQADMSMAITMEADKEFVFANGTGTGAGKMMPDMFFPECEEDRIFVHAEQSFVPCPEGKTIDGMQLSISSEALVLKQCVCGFGHVITEDPTLHGLWPVGLLEQGSSEEASAEAPRRGCRSRNGGQRREGFDRFTRDYDQRPRVN